MKGKKGMATWLIILIVLGIVTVITVPIVYMGYLAVTPVPPTAITYDGEFNDVDVPENVPGTDLTASTAYAESSDDTFNATLATTADVNGTDGQVQYLAFMFEVKGGNGFEGLDIEGELNSACATTEGVIKNAYILMDEEGNTLDKSDAIYTAEVDTDLDKFDFELGVVPDGNYVLVVEWKGIATSTLASSGGLVDIDFDADTDGDVDEGIVYLINA